jgi:hypothetical protein
MSDKRLRLRFVLTHDLKCDAELRDRPLSCYGIAAPLGQKREGAGQAERDCRPVKLVVLTGQVAERLAESGDRLVQTDGTGLRAPRSRSVLPRHSKAWTRSGNGTRAFSLSVARKAKTGASIMAGSFRCAASIGTISTSDMCPRLPVRRVCFHS